MPTLVDYHERLTLRQKELLTLGYEWTAGIKLSVATLPFIDAAALRMCFYTFFDSLEEEASRSLVLMIMKSNGYDITYEEMAENEGPIKRILAEACRE